MEDVQEGKGEEKKKKKEVKGLIILVVNIVAPLSLELLVHCRRLRSQCRKRFLLVYFICSDNAFISSTGHVLSSGWL